MCKSNHRLNLDMAQTRKVQPRDKSWGCLRRCFLLPHLRAPRGRDPASRAQALVPCWHRLEDGILPPSGQALGKCRGLVCLWRNSEVEVSAHLPSLRSPEPLYTKQPPQSGLHFREAVSVEAASRDFSMCFQVKSKPFQLCQETAPPSPLWLSPGVGAGSWGCRAVSSHTPLPQTSHPGPDTLSHPSPTPPDEAQKRALNWSWGVGRGTRKDLIPWMSLMAPALPQSTTGQDWGPVLAGQLHTSPLSLENPSPIFLSSSEKRCVCVCVLRLCVRHLS